MKKLSDSNTPLVGASASPTTAILWPIALAKVIANIGPVLVTFGITFGFYWLQWILVAWLFDSLGWFDFSALWAIIDPEAGTDNSLADQWVELNTSWVGICIDTLAKAAGQEVSDFDLTDKDNMTNLKILSYPMLHSNM